MTNINWVSPNAVNSLPFTIVSYLPRRRLLIHSHAARKSEPSCVVASTEHHIVSVVCLRWHWAPPLPRTLPRLPIQSSHSKPPISATTLAPAIVPRGMMWGSMVAATLIRRRGCGRKRWEGEGHRMGRLRDESGKGFSGRWPAPRFLQANPATIAAGAVISLCDEAVLEGWDYNGKPLSDGVAQQTRTDTKTLLHSLSVSVIYFLLKN